MASGINAMASALERTHLEYQNNLKQATQTYKTRWMKWKFAIAAANWPPRSLGNQHDEIEVFWPTSATKFVLP